MSGCLVVQTPIRCFATSTRCYLREHLPANLAVPKRPAKSPNTANDCRHNPRDQPQSYNTGGAGLRTLEVKDRHCQVVDMELEAAEGRGQKVVILGVRTVEESLEKFGW
ncbi:hypothetical protein NEUTE1DRAFT_120540 [Neurospora tetrasperma FGSC 2508]|uniref:Uncharacterized protein n=1 Tax=Neurospora tetrasperma (strain FGSC 2508 / ATCC MYA-4615 / P0657) TaxID=510951 RepID=F8MEL7_NEUT8|nr:uncharacterized protein NEUTE1DRAFT_120540 [Neurospora tetrasperma FGSC 2508]EGO61646.1 hypothetical protein NEUTE1DRAFT_120540 [Neurospora tetrasperma FGSC 2508]